MCTPKNQGQTYLTVNTQRKGAVPTYIQQGFNGGRMDKINLNSHTSHLYYL